MTGAPRRCYQFGPFRLEVSEHRLLCDGRLVPLTPKVFDVLRVLVQNGGRLVEKDTLLEKEGDRSRKRGTKALGKRRFGWLDVRARFFTRRREDCRALGAPSSGHMGDRSARWPRNSGVRVFVSVPQADWLVR
jgi:hypothetical protein